jgi:hypothetical protein
VSILEEQVIFFEKLFTSEGWDSDSAAYLLNNLEKKINSFSLPFFFSRLKKYFVDFSPFSYQFTFDRILEASAFFFFVYI